MTPKPLTKEEREKIESIVWSPLNQTGQAWIRKLIAAEAYWREAVKHARPNSHGEWDVEVQECPFCLCDEFDERDRHKPDCPWLLAQD